MADNSKQNAKAIQKLSRRPIKVLRYFLERAEEKRLDVVREELNEHKKIPGASSFHGLSEFGGSRVRGLETRISRYKEAIALKGVRKNSADNPRSNQVRPTGPSGADSNRSEEAPPLTRTDRTGVDPIAVERKQLLIDFKDRALSQGIKVTDVKVAMAANPKKWHDRTMVTWWKRNDPRCEQPHDRLIRAVLKRDPLEIWPLNPERGSEKIPPANTAFPAPR
jgi:hypothetical protein